MMTLRLCVAPVLVLGFLACTAQVTEVHSPADLSQADSTLKVEFEAQGVRYQAAAQRLDGLLFVGGDMVVPEAALVNPDRKPGVVQSELAVYTPTIAWPGAVVPYVMPPDFRWKESVERAMADWSRGSVLRFVPRTTEPDYLQIVERDIAQGSCWSVLGHVGGPQEISILSDGCAAHEIGHALGAIHEHQRPDRDAFITVDSSLFNPVWYAPYDAASTVLLSPYDLNSVMHYGTGWVGTLPSILTTHGEVVLSHEIPSDQDYNGVNAMYGAGPSYPACHGPCCGRPEGWLCAGQANGGYCDGVSGTFVPSMRCAVKAPDFNGDGKADFAIIRGPSWNFIPVYFSRGDGSFAMAFNADPSGLLNQPATELVADFDGDGKDDIVLKNGAGWTRSETFFSNGDGSFRHVSVEDLTTVFNQAAQSHVGDFNGDGKADILMRAGPNWGSMPIFFSNGDGTYTHRNLPDLVGLFNLPDVTVHLGDFNADGKTDVLFKNGAGWNSTPIYFSQGDGSFHFLNRPDPSGGVFNYPRALSFVGDFNGDGATDLLVKNGPRWGSFPVFFSNKDGSFTFSNLPTGLKAPDERFNDPQRQTVIADFNADKKDDVMVLGNILASLYAPPQINSMFFSDGAGHFQETFVFDSDLGRNVQHLFGDFYGDGRTGIAVRAHPGWWTQSVLTYGGDYYLNRTSSPDESAFYHQPYVALGK